MSPEGSPHRHLNKLLVNAAQWFFSIARGGAVTRGKRFYLKNGLLLEFLDSYGPSFTKFQLNKKPAIPPPKKKNSGLKLTAGERTAWCLYYVCITLRDLAAWFELPGVIDLCPQLLQGQSLQLLSIQGFQPVSHGVPLGFLKLCMNS